MRRLGFVGYGRFGRAMGELCRGIGCEVVAIDPAAPPEPSLRVDSLGELLARSDLVVVATPVAIMAETFAALAQEATPGHTILDVGSVKLAPSRAMAEIFGARIPWVASHPLFGPVSLARAEPGQRAVLCPNGLHPEAEREIAALYEAMGCSVLWIDAETHDREMAQTHALAFFIAKGLLEMGAPTESAAAPPSFQAMARTVEAVREDAGHLLATLHRENPFAAEYRRLLVSTLGNLDRALNEPPASAESEAIPSGPRPSPNPALAQTRDRIDEVDAELVRLLARRAKLVRRAQRAKAADGRGVVDPERERALLADRARLAEELGLEGAGARAVFEAILAHSCEIQTRQGERD